MNNLDVIGLLAALPADKVKGIKKLFKRWRHKAESGVAHIDGVEFADDIRETIGLDLDIPSDVSKTDVTKVSGQIAEQLALSSEKAKAIYNALILFLGDDDE